MANIPDEKIIELLETVIKTQRIILDALILWSTPKFIYPPLVQPVPIGSPSPWEVTCADKTK